MAENENKTEKKSVEMSIWFIILLVVLIIASALVLSLNSKLGAANEALAAKEAEYKSEGYEDIKSEIKKWPQNVEK